VLGQIESIDVQLLWPLAPGEEGNVYRYQVRVVGQFGSNINVVMLYYKEDQWIAKMEGNENGVTTCSPDTLQWYQIRN